VIHVSELSVERGGVEVLSDVSLTIERGEFLALVGPNGVGKSTLLQTMGGLVPPSAGTVLVDDQAIESLSARQTARLVASVPQDTAFDFDFSVREIVEMGRTPYRKRLRRAPDLDGPAQVDRALERTETARFADRSVASLSGGEKQRVLLARALAQDALALLLDEPTASLDINHQVRTLDLVASLGETVVAAIHDLELAARYADRVALLSDGAVRAVGAPDAVLPPELLESVFGVDVAVSKNAVTGTTSVTALSGDDTP